MYFLNPSYLWALLALAVPLAIHLWSRREGKIIKVGSIKFLKEADTRKSSSLQLNEIWLLLLRMLLLAILVFILSGLHWPGKEKNAPIAYLVEDSLLKVPEIRALTDSLSNTAEVRLLQKDFPDISNFKEEDSGFITPNYWQLAREMENFPADSLVVFSAGHLAGVKGRRPEISKKINWIILGQAYAETQLIGAIQRGDSIELVSVKNDGQSLEIQKELAETNLGEDINMPLISTDSLKIQMFVDEKFQQEEFYLRASLRAVGRYLKHPILIEEFNPAIDADVLIWLSEKNLPESNSRKLKFQENNYSSELIEPGLNSREFILTSKLNAENIYENDLPGSLLRFLSAYSHLEMQIDKTDKRQIAGEFIQTKKSNSEIKLKRAGIDASKHLWLLFLALIIAERLLSAYRKQ
ncbi:BatA domain-containing protein [Salegentibacter sp. HM20]